MAGVREEAVNAIVTALTPYTGDLSRQDLKMRIEISLSPYDIVAGEHDLTVYEGDINEIMLQRFLVAKITKGCSAKTLEFYKWTVENVMQAIGKSYADVTADDIRLYIALRVQRDKVSKVTADNERRILSSFFTWLHNEEIIDKNPMTRIDAVKAQKKKKKAYSVLDLERIRAGCRTNRERAIVEMLASTWCRVSELAQIRIDEIHDGKVIVHGKGGKDREVYINARASVILDSYLQERKDTNPYLFPRMAGRFSQRSGTGSTSPEWYGNPDCVDPQEPTGTGSIEGIVRRIGRKAVVENVHPHRFRRTGATLALRQGMPLTTVSRLLGHENIATTQIYLDISDDELELAHRKYVL